MRKKKSRHATNHFLGRVEGLKADGKYCGGGLRGKKIPIISSLAVRLACKIN